MKEESELLHEQTRLLLSEYHRSQSVAIRNKIVITNMGLVRMVAHRFSKIYPEPYDDLEQLGCMGLLSAVKNFSLSKDNRFSSYAVPYIEGTIRHYLRDKRKAIKIPRGLDEIAKQGEKIRKIMLKQGDDNPSDLEISNRLEISLAQWKEAREANRFSVPLSLDMTIASVEGSILLGDSLPDHIERKKASDYEEHQVMYSLLKNLDEKYQQVITLFYIERLNRKKVAELMGVTPMTITRRLKAAIELLREQYRVDCELLRY